MKKNILLLMFLFSTTQLVHAATFTIVNYSGRDVLVKAFWMSKTPLTFFQLAAGKSLSYDSGLHGIEKIEWITDQVNGDGWVKCTVGGDSGKILDALKTMRTFRIYENGKYEHNFSGSSEIRQANQELTRDIVYVGATEVRLNNQTNPYLVVENLTNGTILVDPPVTRSSAQRGFIVNHFDCIAPGGSKMYYVGNPPIGSGAYVNYGATEIKHIRQDGRGQWFLFVHPIKMPNIPGGALPGKIQIVNEENIMYKISLNGNLYTINPTGKTLMSTPPGQCQLSK